MAGRIIWRQYGEVCVAKMAGREGGEIGGKISSRSTTT